MSAEVFKFAVSPSSTLLRTRAMLQVNEVEQFTAYYLYYVNVTLYHFAK